MSSVSEGKQNLRIGSWLWLGAWSNDPSDMKRKASEEADTPDSKHRSKKARTESFNEIKVRTTQSEHLTYLC